MSAAFGGSDAEPDDGPCEPPGTPQDVYPCPACGLKVPLCPDGQLAAHAWYRGELDHGDGDDLAVGEIPEPSRWIGGCNNRAPTLTPTPKRDTH